MFSKEGYEFITPFASPYFFGDLTDDDLKKLTTKLTEDEAKDPQAGYFYTGLAQPTPEQEAARKAPMDERHAIMPQDFAKEMLRPEYMDVEDGYCVLENGLGYVAALVPQTGRDNARTQKFMDSFAKTGDLYYKTWCPGQHLIHYAHGDGAVEDFGWGMVNMHFNYVSDPKMLGMDSIADIEKADPSCIQLILASYTGNILGSPDDVSQAGALLMYTRETECGRELRLRYWIGMHATDDGLEIRPNDTPVPMLEKARLTMIHGATEYMNENRLINEYWEENTK
jgi:hypothetical protein